MNKKVLSIVGFLLTVVVVLLLLPKAGNNNSHWNTEGLPCIVPNVDLIRHWHPHLEILVDNQKEEIPVGIGLGGSCESPLHTHQTDGVIHLEAQVLRDFTLGDFMKVYGKPVQRDGYDLEMTVDDQPNQELGNLMLKDGQQIILKYTSKAIRP